MPLNHSVFRIIKREATDPHGAEGYFIHELYVNADGTMRGWRAGVSIGDKDLGVLKDHMIRVICAFNHEPIKYQDLTRPGFRVSLSNIETHRAGAHLENLALEKRKLIEGVLREGGFFSPTASSNLAGLSRLSVEGPEEPDSASEGTGSEPDHVDRPESGSDGG
jgi:hypothetical protein